MRIMSRSLVVIIIFVVTLFYVGQRVNVIRLGYEIENLKRERKNLEQIHNSLLIERASLISMERIEKIATSYLEMKRPEDNQIVLVKEESKRDTRSKFVKRDVKERDTRSPLKVVKYFGWRM